MELFDNMFRKKFLLTFFEGYQVGYFHALVDEIKTVKVYDIQLMEKVKYVFYMESHK